MEPRDDEVNQQEQDPTSQEPTSQSTRKTGRGPSKPVQESEPMILDFDEFDLPTGKWEFQYGRHIGCCSKRIPITIHDWKHVGELKKDTLWDETKKLFHIDDPNGARKKNFLRALASRFRNFKAELVARFINKKTAPKEGNPNADKKPWELYQGFITEEQWKAFEAYVASDQFKKKSERGKQCSQGNIHRHTLGQKSYSRKRKDWVKEERLPPPSESSTAESSVVSGAVQNRALEWCLAHQRPTKDGKWEVDPTKVETVRVVKQVMEHLEKRSKEKEDGGDSSEIDNDALTKALGKKDYNGYVKGIGRSGVGVGRRKAFGKVSGKGSEPRDAEIQALKTTIAKLEANQSQFVAQLEAQQSEFKAYIASLSEVNKEVVSKPYKEEKSTTIEVPKKCRLAVLDEDGNLVVVADGTCHPSEVIHTSRLLPDYYKVSVDNPYEEHKLVELPVPSPDGETQLGNAKGYFVSWPISLVLFDDAILNYCDKRTMSTSKGEQVGSCDPLRTLESELQVHEHVMIYASERVDRTPQCDLLNMLMVDENHDTVSVPLKGSMLYLKEDQVVWVTSLDVTSSPPALE